VKITGIRQKYKGKWWNGIKKQKWEEEKAL
jgi:hypothetical protein